MSASYIKIGGNLIDNALLESVEVTQELDQHWWCHIACRQTEDLRISVEDSLGKSLQILTYDEQGAEHVIFDGFVLDGSILYEIFGSYTARFTAVTRSYKLDLTEQEMYFRKKTIGDVTNALAGADGLSAEVNCAMKPPKNLVQWGESDFQFLKRLAYENRAWIRPTAQGIQICDSFQSGAKLQWRDSDGLLDFDVAGQIGQPSFNGTHSDARGMLSKAFSQVKKDPDFFGSSARMVAALKRASQSLPSGFVHIDSRTATADEYQDALERESIRSVGGGVLAHGHSRAEGLKPGDTIEVSGVLDATGKYGLTKVIHRWVKQGYTNEFWCTPWTTYFNPEAPQPRSMPGVVLARVVDQNDPRKMGRIKVQYDWQEQGETAWARMTTPHSGSDRGFMFMPEAGDEVLLGFEHGDPERPYILGSLWNGVDQAPREVFWGGDIESNDVKRIVTKSGHRIQLSDKDGKESIVIATPTHLKIAMLEKADETGRSMILLYSNDGDIFFNAPNGRLHLHSSQISEEVGGGS
jgi:Rhs element Vgr protein